jgi:hypothetical protein
VYQGEVGWSKIKIDQVNSRKYLELIDIKMLYVMTYSQGGALVLWKSQRKSIIISRELHERIRQTCTPELPDMGAVTAVRSVSQYEEVIVGEPLGLSGEWLEAAERADERRRDYKYAGI